MNRNAQEDSYEPATLEVAWSKYRDSHAEANSPVGRAAFRAGFRRGVAQGALICGSAFVHSVPQSDDSES